MRVVLIIPISFCGESRPHAARVDCKGFSNAIRRACRVARSLYRSSPVMVGHVARRRMLPDHQTALLASLLSVFSTRETCVGARLASSSSGRSTARVSSQRSIRSNHGAAAEIVLSLSSPRFVFAVEGRDGGEGPVGVCREGFLRQPQIRPLQPAPRAWIHPPLDSRRGVLRPPAGILCDSFRLRGLDLVGNQPEGPGYDRHAGAPRLPHVRRLH